MLLLIKLVLIKYMKVYRLLIVTKEDNIDV